MGHATSRPAVPAAITGLVLVAAFAGLGAQQILVLNPLAAVPGLTLGEIHGELAAMNETLSPVPVIIFVAIGLVLASSVAAYAFRAPSASRLFVTTLILVILGFGSPAYFAASFSAGMALADAFAISGGDHSAWSSVLHVTSAVALVGAVALLVARAVRARALTQAARS